jgi:hypothetical protein
MPAANESALSQRWISWRDDPADTFSDFTIVIASGPADVEDVTTYHVHKNVVASGRRKSAYFERLFKSGCFRENSSGTSRIDLQPSWKAGAFPWLLEYQYKLWEPFEFTAENVLPLLDLGEYFDVRQLRDDALAFWKRDLSANNCHVYCERACACGNDSVLQHLEDMCVHGIQQVIGNTAMLRSAPPPFWLNVLRRLPKAGLLHRRSCNALLLAVLTEHEPEDLDAEIFCSFTDPACLPEVVGSDVALALLRYEIQILGDNPTPSPSSSPASLSSLQRRCMDGLKVVLESKRPGASRKAFQTEVSDRLSQIHPRLVEPFLLDAVAVERLNILGLKRPREDFGWGYDRRTRSRISLSYVL